MQGAFFTFFEHFKTRSDDQIGNGNLDPLKGFPNKGDIQKGIQKYGNQINDNKRGQHNAQSGAACAQKARVFPADIACAVDGDRPRRGFGDDGDMQKLLFADPLFLLHADMFDKRKHGIAAAEGK